MDNINKKDLDSLATKINQLSVAIYLNTKSGNQRIIGTGFFVKRNKRIFFITAAHCIRYIDEIQAIESYKGPMLIAFGNDVYVLDKQHSIFKPTTDRTNPVNAMDVSIIEMTPFRNIIDEASEIILDLDKLSPTDLGGDHFVSIVGFPIKANKYPIPYDAKEKNELISQAHRYTGMPILPSFDMDAIGCSTEIHYAIDWARKDDRKQTTPLPRGLSGAPVWASTETSIVDPVLAGVFIEHYDKHDTAVFTRIDKVIVLIDHIYSRRQ